MFSYVEVYKFFLLITYTGKQLCISMEEGGPSIKWKMAFV